MVIPMLIPMLLLFADYDSSLLAEPTIHHAVDCQVYCWKRNQEMTGFSICVPFSANQSDVGDDILGCASDGFPWLIVWKRHPRILEVTPSMEKPT